MRIGIMSDMHSNPWAGQAVLDYLRDCGINSEDTYNLGIIQECFQKLFLL